MIDENDYKQIFEETCMSVIEGLVKQAQKADIKDFKQMIDKWIVFYQGD